MPTRRSRLDRRSLQPRDYCRAPLLFGLDTELEFDLPADGDQQSLEVAKVQHQLACLLRRRPDQARARRLTAAFGFSKQFWSDCLAGHAWMGETVLAAAVSALLQPPSKPRRP